MIMDLLKNINVYIRNRGVIINQVLILYQDRLDSKKVEPNPSLNKCAYIL